MNDSCGFMVLQTKLAFPALETKMTFLIHNKRNLFVPKTTSFIDQACSVKMAGYKVNFFFFGVFMDRDEVEVHKKKKKDNSADILSFGLTLGP